MGKKATGIWCQRQKKFIHYEKVFSGDSPGYAIRAACHARLSAASPANAAVIGAYNSLLICATAYTRQGNTCALDLSRDIKVTGEAHRIQWRVQVLKVSEQHLLTNWRVAQYVWPALYNFLILYITEKFYFL